MKSKKQCPYNECDGSGWVEVDPRNPREASTQQTQPCKCAIEEAEQR